MTSELIGTFAGREVYYSFISRIFLNPPDNKIFSMIEDMIPSINAMEEEASADFTFSAEGIRRLINERKSKSGEALKEYDINALREYTRLFCLTDCVPISESYYTSVTKLVMQESRDDALKTYKNYGFTMENDSNEPEDHLSYELEFMSYLISTSRKKYEKHDEANFTILITAQKDFLKRHLLNWAGEFVKKIESYGDNSLYFFMGIFMLSFLKGDYEFLESEFK